MNHPTAVAPEWYRALTLTERLASLPDVSSRQPDQVDAERAGRLLERWRAQAPFDQEELFSRRLDLDGISEEQLRYLLSESAEALRDRSDATPEWLRQLVEAFSFSNEPGGQPEGLSLATLLSEANQITAQGGFLFLIEPLFDQALNRLRAGIRTLIQERQIVPFDPPAVEHHLLTALLEPSLNLLARTLILELNVARVRGQLSGDTPETRFRSFVERLRERSRALSLLEEYPVLARQL
ncbi:MAG TPA: type 2 lantipeptide synthetase LanM, partial [Blastocatellia bacterium]|nr:type 2 lantipeptide synthetase LanM [Blastocatellia bacterium]